MKKNLLTFWDRLFFTTQSIDCLKERSNEDEIFLEATHGIPKKCSLEKARKFSLTLGACGNLGGYHKGEKIHDEISGWQLLRGDFYA